MSASTKTRSKVGHYESDEALIEPVYRALERVDKAINRAATDRSLNQDLAAAVEEYRKEHCPGYEHRLGYAPKGRVSTLRRGLMNDFMGELYGLHVVLDEYKPDRTVAILNGAYPYAAYCAITGKKPDLIEAHIAERERKEWGKLRGVHEIDVRPYAGDERVLLIEDTVSFKPHTHTYTIVKRHLGKKGVSMNNIAVYVPQFDGMLHGGPSIDTETIENTYGEIARLEDDGMRGWLDHDAYDCSYTGRLQQTLADLHRSGRLDDDVNQFIKNLKESLRSRK